MAAATAAAELEALALRSCGASVRVVGPDEDAAREMGAQFMDQLDELGGTLAQKIEERPFASVLIAGAVGYVLAMMTRRR